MIIKYRPVRGGFNESLKEVRFFYSVSELARYLEVKKTDLKSEYQCKDDRGYWGESHLVMKREKMKWFPIGYTNQDINFKI